MTQDNFISFEDYKRKVFEMARLKSRTKEEKEKEINEIREIARKAREKLNPNNDLGKKKVSLKKKVK